MISSCSPRSEERRVGKSVDLGGRRIIKKKKKLDFRAGGVGCCCCEGGDEVDRERGVVRFSCVVFVRLTEGGRLRVRGSCFFFQAEDGIRDYRVTGVQTCALPI